MERKGLSQILYLIIAASVLMMVAMVVTFTATDVIGGVGDQATTTQCQDAVTAECQTLASDDDAQIVLPSTCVDRETNSFLTNKQVYDTTDSDGSLDSQIDAPDAGSTPYYVSCN